MTAKHRERCTYHAGCTKPAVRGAFCTEHAALFYSSERPKRAGVRLTWQWSDPSKRTPPRKP